MDINYLLPNSTSVKIRNQTIYGTKPSTRETSVLEFWGLSSIHSFPLFPGLRWSAGGVVPIRVLSMGQMEIFNHFLVLKPFKRVQTNACH